MPVQGLGCSCAGYQAGLRRGWSWNIGGGIPGETDMASQGQPAKYAFCAAENMEQSPWQALHVERGFAENDSTVTVFACQVAASARCAGSVERIRWLIARARPCSCGQHVPCGRAGPAELRLRPAQELARAGYSKADVKKWVWENARFKVGTLRESGVLAEDNTCATGGHGEVARPTSRTPSDDTLLPMVRDAYYDPCRRSRRSASRGMGFAGLGNYGGYAVTKPIKRPR